MTPKIVTLGEVVADIYREKSESPVEMPFRALPGGAPANVAVAAARLGAQAAFVSSVGNDLFGDFIMRALDAEGVDTRAVVRQESPVRTSLAFVEIFDDGDREFTFYRSKPAADEELSPEDVEPDHVAGASFVNFGSIPLLAEPVRSATRSFAETARELGVPVAFDVNFRAHLWESVEAAREVVSPLLDLSTVAKLSEDETAPLLGVEDIEEAAEALLERGVSLVLISLGAEGAFYATKDFRGRLPSFEVEAVDATGAGDAFLAATLVHLAETSVGEGDFSEDSVREAVRRGTAAGAIACTAFGAMGPLPTREKLEKFMRG